MSSTTTTPSSHAWNEADVLALSQQALQKQRRAKREQQPGAPLTKTKHQRLYRELLKAIEQQQGDEVRSFLDTHGLLTAWKEPSHLEMAQKALRHFDRDVFEMLLEEGMRVPVELAHLTNSAQESDAPGALAMLTLMRDRPACVNWTTQKGDASPLQHAFVSGDPEAMAAAAADCSSQWANQLTHRYSYSANTSCCLTHLQTLERLFPGMSKRFHERDFSSRHFLTDGRPIPQEAWTFVLDQQRHGTAKQWKEIFILYFQRMWEASLGFYYSGQDKMSDINHMACLFELRHLTPQSQQGWEDAWAIMGKRRARYDAIFQDQMSLRAFVDDQQHSLTPQREEHFFALLLKPHQPMGWENYAAARGLGKSVRKALQDTLSFLDPKKYHLLNPPPPDLTHVLVAAASPLVMGLLQTPQGQEEVRRVLDYPEALLAFFGHAPRAMASSLIHQLGLADWTDRAGNTVTHYKIHSMGKLASKTEQLALSSYPGPLWTTPNHAGVTPRDMLEMLKPEEGVLATLDRSCLRKSLREDETINTKMLSRQRKRRAM